MKLDFIVSRLKSNQPPINSNKALTHYIKQAQNSAGLSHSELVKRMGFRNTHKALRRMHRFEQTGQLPEIYRQKLSQVLGLDVDDIRRFEKQHWAEQFADLGLFIDHFRHIWPHRKMIIRLPDYANISFRGLYLSVAYLGAPQYTIGILLQHYMNGDWMDDQRCCGEFFIIGAGGSPLSGRNTCHGFCGQCLSQQDFSFARFGKLLKAHQGLEPACEQRSTDKTMTDLLRDFSL